MPISFSRPASSPLALAGLLLSGALATLLAPQAPGTAALAAGAVSPVNLGSAANYAVLSKAGISSTGTTRIVGNIATSPIAGTAITGFGLTMDSSGCFS